MGAIDNALNNLGATERMASGDTPAHRLDPRAKIVTAAVFVMTLVSFKTSEVGRLLPFFLFPFWLAGLGGIGFGFILRRLLLVSPFALFVAVWNPIFERETALVLWGVEVSGGWLGFASIMLRFALTVSIAVILVATTGFQRLCSALGQLGVPGVLVTQLQFLYRYIFVLGDEGARLARARQLRSFGRSGHGPKVFGQMIGSLLLRALDRAERIGLAMRCRGFTGLARGGAKNALGAGDVAHMAGWCAFFAALRAFDVPELIGALVMGR